MKSVRNVIVAFIICLATASAEAQVANLDTMIHKLFVALKEKDEAVFLKLYPGGKQLNRMMRAVLEPQIPMMKAQLIKAVETNAQLKGVNVDSLIESSMSEYSDPNVMKKLMDKAVDNFKKTIDAGEAKGINWQSAVFLTYEADSVFINSEINKVREAETGIKTFKGAINFTAPDSSYRLLINKVIYMPLEKGWFGGEFGQIVRKGETFRPDDSLETVEVTIKDSAEVPAPPPPPAKPKTKKKTTRTKSPARKTATKV